MRLGQETKSRTIPPTRKISIDACEGDACDLNQTFSRFCIWQSGKVCRRIRRGVTNH